VLAVRAELARQPLRGDEVHAGGDVERRHAMLTSRIRVDGASLVWTVDQHQVARLRGLDREISARFQVADLADHDDVGSWRRNARRASAKVKPVLSLTLTWLTPGSEISAGSSAVEMFTPGWFEHLQERVEGHRLAAGRWAR